MKLEDGTEVELNHGRVVIAAITSCTNTSNPSVMIGAGLLAKKAVEAGLESKPWVKTSLAPGSTVVTEYLEQSGLDEYLDKLGFNLVGYGCTTCIGNSGPLPEEIAKVVEDEQLVVCSVLSGNRNFEGRINPDVRNNYLASPPLCVAYALAGRMDHRPDHRAARQGLGRRARLPARHLARLARRSSRPSPRRCAPRCSRRATPTSSPATSAGRRSTRPTAIATRGPTRPTSASPRTSRAWSPSRSEIEPIEGARVLAVLGDSVTTDHISPAGAIKKQSPAGQWLIENGVEPKDFNSYGSRRGNHEVMIRGTFANVRLRNKLVDREGGFTRRFPDGEETTIYEAAMSYADEDVPLVVLAGKEYGSGSSRDWAAKGTALLGVRAVIAESFERIHRSNLIGMGVVPLQFPDGESVESLGLTGEEVIEVGDLERRGGEERRGHRREDGGDPVSFEARVRIDTPNEVLYFRNGGILHHVLRPASLTTHACDLQ